MAYHWIPPPAGYLKINVHGAYSATPFPNGNQLGIGAIYRNQSGVMKHITVGVLTNLTTLGNQFWAIYAPMRRAFLMGYKAVIVETDNYEAFKAVRNFSASTPPRIFDVVSQIDGLMKNRNWVCSVAYVFPARNRVARYTAKLGMKVGDMLYTLERPVGAVEELLDWDLGLGVDHPDYMDVALPLEAPDLVNFDMGLTFADNVDNLGLGQDDAPQMMSLDMDDDETIASLDGVMEQTIITSNSFDENFLFANEPPLTYID